MTKSRSVGALRSNRALRHAELVAGRCAPSRRRVASADNGHVHPLGESCLTPFSDRAAPVIVGFLIWAICTQSGTPAALNCASARPAGGSSTLQPAQVDAASDPYHRRGHDTRGEKSGLGEADVSTATPRRQDRAVDAASTASVGCDGSPTARMVARELR
jgi:hypothetical protein